MRKVKFAKKYDHYVKGSHMTSYPAGFEGEVANDVAERAEAGGYLDPTPTAKPAPPAGGTGTGTDKPDK